VKREMLEGNNTLVHVPKFGGMGFHMAFWRIRNTNGQDGYDWKWI